MAGACEQHETGSVEETLALAASLASRLRPGDVLHLHGDLGAGKTHFVKGLARGLELDEDDVLSPTFTLVQVHEGTSGRPGLVHCDLYRVSDTTELEELGLTELPGFKAIAAIEWPERLGVDAAASVIHVELSEPEGGGEDSRLIEIRWPADEAPSGRIA
jgi:tRNA threonylcarbamoyladenosine biosynthesis protein TsaE